jgi:hypothetical protein
VFDNKCLRKILKIDWRDHVTNVKVREMARTTPAIEIIRKQRLKWFGHIIRMEKTRMVKLVYEWIPYDIGEKKRGRPATTWNTTIERDLKVIGLNLEEAKCIAKDRDKWFGIIEAHYTSRWLVK